MKEYEWDIPIMFWEGVRVLPTVLWGSAESLSYKAGTFLFLPPSMSKFREYNS